MKIVRKSQTKKLKNSKLCTATEYPLGEKDINGAVIELKGRYPDKGRVVNLRCKELAYIIKGYGFVVVEGKKVNFKAGDLIYIGLGEKYYWDGHCTMFVPCAPAWYPKQHKEVS